MRFFAIHRNFEWQEGFFNFSENPIKMILYRDVISGDEMVTDAFEIKEIDDIAYECDCKIITIKDGGDIDIGANASAEGGKFFPL